MPAPEPDGTTPRTAGPGHKAMEALWSDVLELAQVTVAVMEASVCDGRPGPVDWIKAQERAIDAAEVSIERECLRVLALYGPVASDLRRVVEAMRVTRDLERIGDLAEHIARRTRKWARDPVPVPPCLGELAAAASGVVRDALSVLREDNAAGARRVIAADSHIDRLRDAAMSELKGGLARDPARVNSWLSLIHVARHLERAGDRASNVAESVIYLVEGVIVRHGEFGPGG